MASMAVLYVLAVALLMSARTSLRRAVLEIRLVEHSHGEKRL